MSTRARVLVVLAFVLSAGMFAAAAVAFVLASRDDKAATAQPTLHPTLIIPTTEPPAPSATPTPTPAASATSTPTPSPTPAVTASPRPSPRASSSPRPVKRTPVPSPTRTVAKPGLFADMVIDPAQGDTTTATPFKLSAHATDGDGTISLKSVRWDANGPAGKEGTVKECASTGTGDCKDFAMTHFYSTTGWHDVTLTLTSGPKVETAVMHVRVFVKSVAASPSPAP